MKSLKYKSKGNQKRKTIKRPKKVYRKNRKNRTNKQKGGVEFIWGRNEHGRKKTYQPFKVFSNPLKFFSSKKSSNNKSSNNKKSNSNTETFENFNENEINEAIIKTRYGKESAKNTVNRLSPNLSENSGYTVLPNSKQKIINQKRKNNLRNSQKEIKEAQEWVAKRPTSIHRTPLKQEHSSLKLPTIEEFNNKFNSTSKAGPKQDYHNIHPNSIFSQTSKN